MLVVDVNLTVKKLSEVWDRMESLLNALRPRVALAGSILLAVACSDNSVSPVNSARLRVVNSLYQGASAATAVPVAIDVVLDSSDTAPGSVIGLGANQISAGTTFTGASAGVRTTTPVAGYTGVPTGVHSFLARVSGAVNSTVYTTTSGTAFLPQEELTPFPYTLVVAGIIPLTGRPPYTAVPFVILAPEDPFTPPVDNINGGLTARLRVINAAPMASATGAGARITATFIGTPGTFTAAASYRGVSPYVNPPAGTYTLTLVAGTTTLFTGSVVLAKGEVRSFIVQSTGYSATPGPGNTKVTNVLDNQY